jgi:beta-lactamase class A
MRRLAGRDVSAVACVTLATMMGAGPCVVDAVDPPLRFGRQVPQVVGTAKPGADAAQNASSQVPAGDLKQKFERRLQDIASKLDGVVGYSVLDLTSGDRFGHLARATFPAASAIKLAIVYELFKQVDEGRIRLDERLTLDRASAVGGTGVLSQLGTPTLSIRDCATLMVIVSDNTAANILIDRLGMENVTGRMQGLGLGDTKLRRRMMDVAAARRGDENVSTPDDLVNLLQAMYRPIEGAGHAMAAAIELLEKPKDSRLRRGLPQGIAAADKPGELEGVRVDAGIVFAKNRPYILAVMTTFLRSEIEGERAIEEMARAAYDYFNRLGSGGALGRQMSR